MRYNLKQRIFIYDTFVKCKCWRRCRRRFLRKYPDLPAPSKSMIYRLVSKVRTSGMFSDLKPKRRRRVLTQEKLDEIGAALESSPRKSVISLAQQVGISQTTAHVATKLLKLKQYKTNVVQKLTPPDSESTINGTFMTSLDYDVIRMASAGSLSADDDELTLPRASINKMIKEILPNIRVANESRELILNCCTEFIHLLSSEANDICNHQQKKTINAEHVLQALDRLGFGDYRADAEAVLRDCKAVAAKRRRQSTRLENLGIPEEELLRQQQELFAKAREEQAAAEQQQWQQLQAAAQMVSMQQSSQELDLEDYS